MCYMDGTLSTEKLFLLLHVFGTHNSQAAKYEKGILDRLNFTVKDTELFQPTQERTQQLHQCIIIFSLYFIVIDAHEHNINEEGETGEESSCL